MSNDEQQILDAVAEDFAREYEHYRKKREKEYALDRRRNRASLLGLAQRALDMKVSPEFALPIAFAFLSQMPYLNQILASPVVARVRQVLPERLRAVRRQKALCGKLFARMLEIGKPVDSVIANEDLYFPPAFCCAAALGCGISAVPFLAPTRATLLESPEIAVAYAFFLPIGIGADVPEAGGSLDAGGVCLAMSALRTPDASVQYAEARSPGFAPGHAGGRNGASHGSTVPAPAVH